ncbi:MAG: VWA domain-containing protein [Thermoanaerobaculia bacterium]
MTSRIPELASFALLAALAAAPTGAQAPPPEEAPGGPEPAAGAPQPREERLLVEVVDGRGEPVESLTPGALTLLVDGEAQPVGAVERAAPERIALYFDLPSLATPEVVEAAGVLAARADDLAALAPVEVLLGGDGTRTALPSTGDPEVLAQTLSGTGVRQAGEDELAEVRRAFLAELSELDESRGATEGGAGAAAPERAVAAAREALAEEARRLRLQRERLVSWAASTDTGAGGAGAGAPRPPGTLLLVTGGFDEDPLAFYRAALEARGLEEEAARLGRPVILPSLDEVSRVLAAYGWVVFPYLPEPGEVAETPVPVGPEAPEDPSVRQPDLDPAGSDDSQQPALITPRLGRDREERADGEAPPVRGGREAPERMARGTGGEVVSDPLQLADVLGRLGRRWSVRFQAPEGEPRPLEVRAEGGATVRAPAWSAGTVAPSSVAAVRVRRVLETEGGAWMGDLADRGALALEAAFETPPGGVGEGRLLLRLEGEGPDGEGEPAGPAPPSTPEGTAGPPGVPVRATVGVDRPGRDPLVFHRELGPGSFGPEGVARLPVRLPEGAESRVAVLVEEVGTGRWGAAFASHLESAEEAAGLGDVAPGPADAAELLPAPRAVTLLRPREAFVMGRTEFRAVVSRAGVARVDFFLDGERRAALGEAPFRAVLDVGDLPRPHRVEAVAYDAGGRELGRDLLVVNEGSGAFRVRIVQPGAGNTGNEEEPRVGPVDVAAEVRAPPDARVDRVDFYWNADRVATRFGPPYRQRVVVPEADPRGFVRVVARLEDGTSAEDVVFLNSPGTTERLDVNLVEMYVVVTDQEGRPVTGLGPEDFRVYEEGEAREITTFTDAGHLPLTVGLAIDSSASMFVKLPSVGLAAAEFVQDSLDGDDRAFVVGFGGEPRLVQQATSSDPDLVRSIARLRADGQTALWESVVYSLVQLQGAPGKKALVLYTDGADEDEDFRYQTALRFAREVGVPVYFILTNNEIVRTGGRGLGVRRFLGRVRRLADAVGGRTYIVRHGEDLSAVYREIGRELRSQYLLAYYSEDLPEETFRRVRVEAADPDLEVRTIAGYFR